MSDEILKTIKEKLDTASKLSEEKFLRNAVNEVSGFIEKLLRPDSQKFFGDWSVLSATAGPYAEFGEFWYGAYARTKDYFYFVLPEARPSPYTLFDWAKENGKDVALVFPVNDVLPPGSQFEGSVLLMNKIFRLLHAAPAGEGKNHG